MENTKRCLNCGYEAKQDAKFCLRCGSNQFQMPAVQCPVCGSAVPQNQYCANCGGDLKNPGAQVWHSCAQCGAPVHITYTHCNRCGAPNMPPVQARPVQSKPKKKRSGAWALLLVIPLLLILVGIGVGVADYLENAFSQAQYPGTTGTPWQPGTTQPPAATQDPADTTPPQTQAPTTVPATQPTQPVQTQPTVKPTEPAPTEPVSNIPAKYEDNHYLRGVGDGYCETMTGEMLVIFLFVSDPTDGWTEAERAEAEPALLDELRTLLAEAQSYGAELNIHYVFMSVSIASEFNSDWDAVDWKKEAMINAGLEAGYNDQRTLERDDNVDQAPVVFLVDEPGRSFAYSYTSGSGFENVTILDKNYAALRHEMCHVFGAKDMYFPKETQEAAKLYLPNGIMYGDCEGDIDPLTAFTIGWTDELSDNALAFLEATNGLTEAYIEEAKAQDKLTGYGTKYYDDGSYYTGDLVNGVRHGEGTYYWTDGGYYSGTWVDGERQGYGELYYADGYCFKGNWSNSKRNGYGELTGPDGYSYKGEWKNDKYSGTGTAVYSGGDTYTGDFVDGDRHGKGKYTWSSGTVYTGDWVKGQRTGKGTMTWTDGSSYTGDWVEGLRSGKGKMTWSDGSYYTGDFVEGEITGYGERYYASYGTRYIGDFVNGKRHGYGIFYYANGTVYEGRWENDVRAD